MTEPLPHRAITPRTRRLCTVFLGAYLGATVAASIAMALTI